jgi:signal-transduction protein with cAMP-binding, CBS, and nucleotidyltransferase domain
MSELNIVEKVIALEAVEMFKSLTPDQLARIASIASVERYPAARTIVSPDQPPDSLYVVFDGSVELSQDGEVIHVAGQNEVLGAWALFDDAPLRLTAVTGETTTLLRIAREDFLDLLSDNVEIMAAVFSTLAKRFRKLVEP